MEFANKTTIDINLKNNERIVSLTMIAQLGYCDVYSTKCTTLYYQGFNLDTVDAYGAHKSYVAGYVNFYDPKNAPYGIYGAQIGAWGDNADSTYQVGL
jgi:hypothetical protein